MARATHNHKTEITVPQLALVAATRALLGCGIGLLLAERMAPARRRPIGWALFSLGALSTIPLGMRIFGSRPISREKAADAAA